MKVPLLQFFFVCASVVSNVPLVFRSMFLIYFFFCFLFCGISFGDFTYSFAEVVFNVLGVLILSTLSLRNGFYY